MELKRDIFELLKLTLLFFLTQGFAKYFIGLKVLKDIYHVLFNFLE